MIIGVYFSISSFIIIGILAIIFFWKKSVVNVETKTYSKILILTLFGLFLEIFTCIWSLNGASLDDVFYQFFSKLTSSYYMLWSGLFVNYLINICNIDSLYKKVFNTFNLLCFAMILILPISYNVNGATVTPAGPSIVFTYIVCFFYTFIDLFFCIKYRKQIVASKFMPVYSLLVLGGIDIMLGIFYPSLFLIGYVYSLIVIIMYFTIENPDVKMITQLELAKDAAEKANNAKTDFLSSMSHEIRTPLNAIVGFSEEILKSNTIEEAKENSKDIVEASKILLDIVNGVLDISKIEAGKLEIINSSYDAKEIFTSLANLIRPRIEEKGIEFVVHIAEDIPNVLYGDYANIKKITMNLLTNACKYTDKGKITYNVECIKKDDVCRLVISVEDTGRGIKRENIDKLFTKFERLEEKNTTIEGTGLGLAITKKIVELMGGEIIVQSVYGSGSKFTVLLNQRIDKVLKPKEEYSATNFDLTGKRLLVVDDNKLNLKVANKILSNYNPIIETVDNGFAAVENIKNNKTYDLILLDIMMPKMSGIETLHKLKEIEGFNIPVIALTADAVSGMREKYITEGFDDYLAKPINKNELESTISKVLNKNNDTSLEFSPLPSELYEMDKSLKDIKIDTTSKEETLEEEKEEQGQEEDNSKLDKKEFLISKGVDLNKALELLGDIDMYNETLKIFMDEIDEKTKKLEKAKEKENMEDYKVVVHSIKSDAKYLGFSKLAEKSYEHEMKSKDNDINYIKENFKNLKKIIEEVKEISLEYFK